MKRPHQRKIRRNLNEKFATQARAQAEELGIIVSDKHERIIGEEVHFKMRHERQIQKPKEL